MLPKEIITTKPFYGLKALDREGCVLKQKAVVCAVSLINIAREECCCFFFYLIYTTKRKHYVSQKTIKKFFWDTVLHDLNDCQSNDHSTGK